jgi:hypothetical protein
MNGEAGNCKLNCKLNGVGGVRGVVARYQVTTPGLASVAFEAQAVACALISGRKVRA